MKLVPVAKPGILENIRREIYHHIDEFASLQRKSMSALFLLFAPLRNAKSGDYERGIESDSENKLEKGVACRVREGKHFATHLLIYLSTLFSSFNPSLSSPLFIPHSALHGAPRSNFAP